MSIWNSTVTIGFERWAGWAKRPTGGTVRRYASGFSNHYPDSEVEGPAAIDLATIPDYCVPGHHDDLGHRLGPWLRMGVHGEGRDFWKKETAYDSATVVLNENAVRALRDALTEWLDQPKVHPKRQKASQSPLEAPQTSQETR